MLRCSKVDSSPTTEPTQDDTGFEFTLSTGARLRSTPRTDLAQVISDLSQHYTIYALTAGTREYSTEVMKHLRAFLKNTPIAANW